MTASKTHPTHNKWLRYVSLLENTYPPTPLSTVKLWNCDGIAVHSCDCPGSVVRRRQTIGFPLKQFYIAIAPVFGGATCRSTLKVFV
jgi:hypothetical protein